jgi:hypothetical protein
MSLPEILVLSLTTTGRLQALITLSLIIITVIFSFTEIHPLRAILPIISNGLTTYPEFFQLNTVQQE